MLQLVSLNPTGLFSFGRVDTISLENVGLVHLLGVNDDKGGCSNGSGKSSLFNALCETLWGANPTGVKGKGAVNQVWDEGCASRVEFVSPEGRYRVTYCRSWKDKLFYEVDTELGVEYAGTTLFFDRFQNETWVDLRGPSIAETRKLIESALGLSYEQFLAISHMSPRVGSLFLRGGNKEKVAIVSEIAGLEEWENALILTRSERKKFDNQLQDLDRKVAYESGVRSSLTQQQEALSKENWSERLGVYQAQKLQQGDAALKMEKEISLYSEKLKELNSEQDHLSAKELNNLYAEINALRDSVGRIYNNPTIRAKADESYNEIMKPFEAETRTLQTGISEKRGKLLALTSGLNLADIENCPTCGAKISKAKRDKIKTEIQKAEQDVKDASDRYNELQLKKPSYTVEAERVKEKILDTLKDQEQQLKSEISVKEKIYLGKKNEYDQAAATSKTQAQELQGKIQAIHVDLSRVKQELVNLGHWIGQCQSNLQALEGIVGSLNDQEGKLYTLADERAKVLSECEVYDWLIRNIPFIKLHKLSVYMVQLSNKANEYLVSMGDTIRVSVDAFSDKVKKKGAADMADMLKSEINVMITDGNKVIDAGLYSDGETARITNALIRALHDLSVESGRGCNLVFLDEVFSYVDGANAEKLASSILPTDASTVLITDNSGKVENYVNFNQQWVCRKTNNLTTIEV